MAKPTMGHIDSIHRHGQYREVFPYHCYERYRTKRSMYIVGAKIRIPDGFDCPVCDKRIATLDHGGTGECPCGMKFQLFGNALEMWK